MIFFFLTQNKLSLQNLMTNDLPVLGMEVFQTNQREQVWGLH